MFIVLHHTSRLLSLLSSFQGIGNDIFSYIVCKHANNKEDHILIKNCCYLKDTLRKTC